MLKRWRIRILLFLAVLGPGFITANIDNDSGGIFIYSNAGAQFGYTLLWTMIPITVALLVVQEMCARMGAVTGKGLSDLIREEFGLRMTFLLMLLLVIVNFGNVMAEFVGIAGSMQLFHVSKYISVPASALAIWLLVVKGDYKRVEKVFLAASVFYIAYIVTGVLSQPSWHDAMVATVELPRGSIWHSKSYIYMIVGVIGTTISPWMQFYLQSSIVEKGVTAKSYRASRLDVIIGSFFTNIVAWFIVVACAATLFAHGMGAIKEAADAAQAMKPLAGRYAFLLFAVGLVQCFAVCRVHSAAFHGLHGLRGAGSAVRSGWRLQRCAGLLLAVYPSGGGRSHCRSVRSQRQADQHGHPVAGIEWRAAAPGDRLHAAADQSQGPDG